MTKFSNDLSEVQKQFIKDCRRDPRKGLLKLHELDLECSCGYGLKVTWMPKSFLTMLKCEFCGWKTKLQKPEKFVDYIKEDENVPYSP